MSSSGSSGRSGFEDGGGDQLDCNIVERISLTNPVVAVIATIKKGDQLPIEIRQVGQREAVVAKKNGQIAGAIILSSVKRMGDLIACIRRGNRYDAIVLSVKGAICEVEVHPA